MRDVEVEVAQHIQLGDGALDLVLEAVARERRAVLSAEQRAVAIAPESTIPMLDEFEHQMDAADRRSVAAFAEHRDVGVPLPIFIPFVFGEVEDGGVAVAVFAALKCQLRSLDDVGRVPAH